MENVFYDYVRNNKVEYKSDEEIRQLIFDYRIKHDLDARDQVIANFYNMALSIINQKILDTSKREDYISVTVMALIKAIDDYDLDSFTKFSTFAHTYMQNAIRFEHNKNNGLINVPYVEYVNAQKYYKAKKKLEETYGRSLSIDELSEILDLKQNKVLDYENEMASICSLNKPLGEDIELGDVISDSYSLEEQVEIEDNKNTLMNNISLLKDKRQQLILLYTYGFMDGVEHTQAEAADMLVSNGFDKLSRQGVQKLQKKAIQELQSMYN